jgi:hypothetical protein
MAKVNFEIMRMIREFGSEKIKVNLKKGGNLDGKGHRKKRRRS